MSKQHYHSGKAWDEAVKCLKFMTMDVGTLYNRIVSALTFLPNIKIHSQSANLDVCFYEDRAFKGIDIGTFTRRSAGMGNFENIQKINIASKERKYKMIDELVEYCCDVIVEATKVETL